MSDSEDTPGTSRDPITPDLLAAIDAAVTNALAKALPPPASAPGECLQTVYVVIETRQPKGHPRPLTSQTGNVCRRGSALTQQWDRCPVPTLALWTVD